ncbi:hypothetical protein [Glycomyces buryatensis]|uniref:hypothetical protein n=1 Tax=Glycomyces buryatensis TaxID=2570927 RepID=UPI001B3C161B|nr:hypothetical protein [Glycomyces buryatensis]
MRKSRVLHLVLAAILLGAVSTLLFAPKHQGTEVPEVDWVNADETNSEFPPVSPSPSYDGDGTSDPDGEEGSGESGEDGQGGPDGGGDAGEPGMQGPDEADSGDGAGGLLGLSFPVQAGMSVGILALAFAALLPGRKMPANLRGP